MEILRYTFFQNALWGGLFTAIACGIVGTYVVSRRLVFISGGVTHASFGGLGLGFYLGINPFLTALGFAVLSAFGVEWMSRSRRVREDSAIAAIWSLGMAIGAIFIVLTPGYAPNLSSYLFAYRYLLDRRIRSGPKPVFYLILPGSPVFGLRSRLCPDAGASGQSRRIRDDTFYFRDHRTVHPARRHYAADELAHRPADDGQSLHLRLSQNHLRKHRLRLCFVRHRTVSLLHPPDTFRRIYHRRTDCVFFSGETLSPHCT